MTISAPIDTRHNYSGNGSTTSFAYSVKIDTDTELTIIHTDTNGIENALGTPTVDVDYTVNGAGNAGGGTVDFPKAGSVYNTLATGEKLSILYNFPIKQDLDIPNTGRVFNENVEDALDYVTKLINQVQEVLDRSLKLPDGSTLTGITYPQGTSAANRGGKAGVWNSAGTDLELVTINSSTNVDPIAVRGDIAQGDALGNPAKLAIGATGKGLSVANGLLAYDWFRNLTTTKGGDIASATALVIPDSKDRYWDVTGTTTITSFSATNLAVGAIIGLHFDDALILTHHSTDLVLPGGSNITTVAGDEAWFIQYATDDYRLISFVGHNLYPAPGELTGKIVAYAGATAPAGWLLCDGTTGLSTAADPTLAPLFAVIGIAFGGTSSIDFALPDMRGNTPLGKDNMGGISRNRVIHPNADNMGGQHGEEVHTLTVSEIPSHRHEMGGAGTIGNGGPGQAPYGPSGSGNYTMYTGGNLSHNNMPTYMALNFIIKK